MRKFAGGKVKKREWNTAARAAAFSYTCVQEQDRDVCPENTGVRADWMEQDGPALVLMSSYIAA